VTCEEARLLLGAEPGFSGTGLEEHLHGCPGCARFRAEMLTLDANIRRALEQPPQLPHARRRPAPWRQWALAASVVFAMFAVVALWVLRPTDTLARDVVAHVQHEPESWLATQQVSAQSIGAALHGAGVELGITSDKITYAQSCWFRGHYVPHLVVQTAQGPVTVMILRHEQVSGRRAFREAGMSGVIVPDGAGSIAVLSKGGSGGDLDAIAGQMQRDVHWLPAAY
jgi:Protein of unknown function (DUF3379)